MDIPKTLFATLVKQGRMEMHLTQEALAEKLGISAAYLGDLERHKGGPSLESVSYTHLDVYKRQVSPCLPQLTEAPAEVSMFSSRQFSGHDTLSFLFSSVN